MYEITTFKMASGLQIDQEIRALHDGKIGAICIKNFIAQADCQSISNLVSRREKEFDALPHTNVKAKTFGHSTRENDQIGSFSGKGSFQHDGLFHTAGVRNPGVSVLKLLSRNWPSSAALFQNADGVEYPPGEFRWITSVPLHNDFAGRRRESPFTNQIEQLSWNVFLSSPCPRPSGTQVFQRRWRPSDQSLRFENPKQMGYPESIVKNVPSCVIFPQVGELVLFRSTNYHKVAETTSGCQRLTYTSFVASFGIDSPLRFFS